MASKREIAEIYIFQAFLINSLSVLIRQKREIRNYCQSAMVSDFFCFLVIYHDVPLLVASGVPMEYRKITAEYPSVTVMPKLKTKGYLL